jgi:hypothetical protein
MSDRTKPIADLSRWHAASEETFALLQQNEALMQERTHLCARRAALFRDILRAAQGFVDQVEAGVIRRG